MDQDREISREELHQLVWSKPTRTVAKEFGLSDEEKMSRLVVGSENIRFYVREQSKQTIEKGSYYDRHVYSPKGKLSFILDSYPRRAWHDGKEQRLEALLGEIVVGTFQFGEILRADRLKWEDRHRRWEEERRLRELEEEARKKEAAKERAFRAQVEQWNLCKMMREYIIERERALNAAALEPERNQEALEWIDWARGYVDRIDPLKKGFEIAQSGESHPSRIDEDSDETS
jgi:hypothetical protein